MNKKMSLNLKYSQIFKLIKIKLILLKIKIQIKNQIQIANKLQELKFRHKDFIVKVH